MSALLNQIDGPAARTMSLMAAAISSPQICSHLLPFLKLEIGVVPVVPLLRRYVTWQRMAATGHPWGWLVLPCLIDPPLTPFFYVVNRRLAKSTCARMLFLAVAEL